MFINYFKIAIAVLRRRKFFTFISLFGISFTLAILMVLTAFKDSLLSGNYPETRRDYSLYINRVVQKNIQAGYTMNSDPSFSFLEKYVSTLKTPAKVAIGSLDKPTSIYLNNKKLDLHIKYTNASFWEVFDFTFLEGKAFSQEQILRLERVAVISEEAKRQYFGNDVAVTGRYITADNIEYRVIGVIKSVPILKMYSYSDIYVPYTSPKSNYENKSYMGNYSAVLLASSRADVPKMQKEFEDIVARLKPEDPAQYNFISTHADYYTESFTRAILGNNNDSGISYLYMAIGIFIFLFMLLPTINLVNINVSRIMERSSEIGVRKAFGASSGDLVIQFIFENVILTLLGGIIGVVIAGIVMWWINSSNLIPNTDLMMNLGVLTYSVLLCLIFGFFSGVFPAWRMSRLHVIKALRSGA